MKNIINISKKTATLTSTINTKAVEKRRGSSATPRHATLTMRLLTMRLLTMRLPLLLSIIIIIITVATPTLTGCTTPANTNRNTVTIFHYNLKIDNTSPIYQAIYQATGVHIAGIYAPASSWSNKLSTMALANDLPDLFITYGPGFSDGDNLRDKNALLNLAPYIHPETGKSPYPNLHEHLAQFDFTGHNSTETYFIPVSVGIEHTFVFRQDMLDAVGAVKPTTLDEFYTAAKKIRAAYGIYPITSGDYTSGGLRRLNQIFYASGGSWYEWAFNNRTQQLEPDWISSNNKEAVRYIRKLYTEQLLDPDFFTNTDAAKNKKIYASQAAIAQVSNYGRVYRKLLEQSPEARLSYSPVLFGKRKEAGIQRMPFLTALSIPADRDDQTVRNVLTLLDYLYSDEGRNLLRYGVDGVHYDQNTMKPLLPSTGVLPYGDKAYDELRNVDTTATLRLLVEKGGMYYVPWTPYYNDMVSIVETGNKYARFDQLHFRKTKRQKLLEPTLNDFAISSYVRMIVAPYDTTYDTAFDNNWTKFVKEYLDKGGRELILEQAEIAQ